MKRGLINQKLSTIKSSRFVYCHNMGKKIIEVGIYDWIYGRLECIEKVIGIPMEIIINNWLMKGGHKDWRVFTGYIEELDEEKVQGEALQSRLNDFFDELADHYYEEDETSKEFGFQEKFIEEHFDFSSFKEEDNFRKQYFSKLTERQKNDT